MRLALRLARGARMRWAAACTAQERVGAFFERHGSERTPPDELPTRRAPGQLAAHRDI